MSQQRVTEQVATTSGDVLESQIAKLREAFPEVVSEGKVDFDKLRGLLGAASESGPGRFSFTWAGKADALALLQTPSQATLVPAEKDSVNFHETGHVFIEGDNLEVLKLLFKPYFGRIKLIYIDPPYNTGQDFVYPDNYTDPLKTYLQITGQIDAGGNLLTSNPETSGRYHSAWLSMMYPRLFLARQLLREDGLLCVSIDDNEVHHLRAVLNEVFGEENYYATVAWQKKDTPSNDAKGMSVTHEYVLIYQRSGDFTRNLLPRTEEQLGNYKNPDADPRGPWTRTSLIRKEVRTERCYPVTNPSGRERRPPPGTSWRIPPEKFAEKAADNRLWWGQDADGDLPFLKRFLSEVQDGVVPISWWDYEFAGSNRNAKMELRDLFDGDAPFETPKPVQLVKRLLDMATTNDEDQIVLDFFAGSCTTAHAVLELNHEDNGERRFIMVQLPEPTGNAKYPTIADIGKDRIRRVLTKLRTKATGRLPFNKKAIPEDLGFKVFKLNRPNIQQWTPEMNRDPEAYAQKLLKFEDPLLSGWTPENVLWEVALREGHGLNTRFETKVLANKNTIYEVKDPETGQQFAVCLDSKVRADLSRHYELQLDRVLVCRDVALNDTAAANLALQCRLKTI
jgi:adenine-specific DNA-methyltransferase